nr:tetratricopeptide repeat protein [Deltaproteobacteria bacterium]
RLAIAWLCVATATAFADGEPEVDVDAALVRVRAHFAKGEIEAAKQLLLATYASTKRADLLFALGQAEYNLGHYKQAIDYYEQFLASNPETDATSLAHQAIGSARARLDAPVVEPRPPPPPSPRQPPQRARDWDGFNTALVIGGGAVAIAGGGLFAAGFRAGDDRSGSLTDYDRRLERSLLAQRAGVAIAAGGVVLVGIGLLRWSVRRIEITPSPPTSSAGTIGLAARGRW